MNFKGNVIAGMAHPLRISILLTLDRPKTPREIMSELDTPLKLRTVCKHLEILEEAGLVKRESVDSDFYFSLSFDWEKNFIDGLKKYLTLKGA